MLNLKHCIPLILWAFLFQVSCFGQAPSISLDSAYAQQSDSLLNEFYLEWKSTTAKNVTVIEDTEIQKTIESLTKLVVKYGVYSGASYTIFPTEIQYGIVKSLKTPRLYGTMTWDEWPIWKFIKYNVQPHITDTLFNYAPAMRPRILYLSKEYRTTIDNFLQLDKYDKGDMFRLEHYPELKKRVEFLSTGSAPFDKLNFIRPSSSGDFTGHKPIDVGLHVIWTYCPVFLLIDKKMKYAYHVGVINNVRVFATIYKKVDGTWIISGGRSCSIWEDD